MGYEVLGLAGYAQSGKDTVGRYLVEKHGYKRLAFADCVREAAYSLDPLVAYTRRKFQATDIPVIEHIRLAHLVDDIGWEAAKQFPDVRRLLQRMGTEVGRELFGEEVWVDRMFKKMDDLQFRTGATKIVITDLRFSNELKCCNHIWLIERDGVSAVNDHKSEQLPDFVKMGRAVKVIKNNGTLNDLDNKVDDALRSYGD